MSKIEVKSPFTPDQEKALSAWTTKYPYTNLGLIEALRSVQDWHRQVTPEAVSFVADFFKLPFNHVWGVATFFPTFTRWKTGEKRVGVCHGLSCFLKGSGKAEKCLEKTLGVPKKQATPDGKPPGRRWSASAPASRPRRSWSTIASSGRRRTRRSRS